VITVTQECDGCGTKRGLRILTSHASEITLKWTPQEGGWRTVDSAGDGKHLCDQCIQAALAGRQV
jgi:hypothetical protein